MTQLVVRSGVAAAALLVGAAALHAADLAKVQRTIGREPKYESDSPRYCLMVFGPEAKERVWLVLDGKSLYVDRNANGDLTDEGERLGVETPDQDPAQFESTELTLNGKQHKFKFYAFGWFDYRDGKAEAIDPSIDVWWNDKQRFGAWGDQESPLRFSDSPRTAPIVHIGGPLQMGFEVRHPLTKREEGTFDLNTAVGTKGLGPGTFAHLVYNVIPDDVFPQATLEFPSADPKGRPIKIEMPIKHRC
jgi:hypothetical protein